MLFFYLFIFLVGASIGSFIDCIVYRVEKGQKFLFNRSYCPNCNHELSSFDLIPILSFLFLRGKCRYCSKKISLMHPIIELITGILFFLIFFKFGFNALAIYYFIIATFLIFIFLYDLKYFIIPDKVVFSAIFFVLASHFINYFENFNPDVFNFSYIFAAFISALFFYSIYFFSKGSAMGFGDVKLGFLLGLIFGFPKVLLVLWLAFIIGGPTALILVLLKKKNFKSQIPLGPFLVIGAFITILFSSEILLFFY